MRLLLAFNKYLEISQVSWPDKEATPECSLCQSYIAKAEDAYPSSIKIMNSTTCPRVSLFFFIDLLCSVFNFDSGIPITRDVVEI